VAEALKRTLTGDALAGDTSKDLRERVNKAIAKATGWAANSAATVHDPYANALRLNLAGDATTATRLRAELSETATHDQAGAHWSRPGYSPFYGWGYAGELETTAMVLSALNRGEASPNDRALANDALFHLLRSQDRYGIWLSGQATVRALQALLQIAKDVTDEHHMVAQAAKRAKATLKLLEDANVAINDAMNTVELPYAFHKVLHTGKYYKYVQNLIKNALDEQGDKMDNVTDALNGLKNDLEACAENYK